MLLKLSREGVAPIRAINEMMAAQSKMMKQLTQLKGALAAFIKYFKQQEEELYATLNCLTREYDSALYTMPTTMKNLLEKSSESKEEYKQDSDEESSV